MARDCAIGCPGKVRKSLSYLYPSFLGLDVVLMGSALYLKPWQVCVRKAAPFSIRNLCWVTESFDVTESSGVTCGELRFLLGLQQEWGWCCPGLTPSIPVIPLTLGRCFLIQLLAQLVGNQS